MYETKQETVGLRRCLGSDRTPQRVECVSAAVLYEGQRSRANLRENKGARTRRQTRTGGVKTSYSNDNDILAGKPTVIRWFWYAVFSLTVMGVIPCLLAWALFAVIDAFNCSWVIAPLFAAEIALICKMVG